MRILHAESDRSLADLTNLCLRSEGHVVEHAETGEETLEICRLYSYDVILLGAHLSDMECVSVVHRLRTMKCDHPILVMSADFELRTRVRALQAGADDFVLLPIHRDELDARVHALVRRSQGLSRPLLTCGPLEMDLTSQEVRVSGRRVHLTGREQQILEVLMRRAGTVLSKTFLLDYMYSGMPDVVSDKILDVYICKIRTKIGPEARGLIRTHWGRGFSVSAPQPEAVAAA